MMSARDIIHQAALDLRVVDQTDGLPGEIHTRCLNALNTMLRSWKTVLKHVDYDPFNGATELDSDDPPNLPDEYEGAIISNLTVRLAPSFNKQTRPETLSFARMGWSALRSKYGWPEAESVCEFGYFNGDRSYGGL